jgi:hypothetical protein
MSLHQLLLKILFICKNKYKDQKNKYKDQKNKYKDQKNKYKDQKNKYKIKDFIICI